MFEMNELSCVVYLRSGDQVAYRHPLFVFVF